MIMSPRTNVPIFATQSGGGKARFLVELRSPLITQVINTVPQASGRKSRSSRVRSAVRRAYLAF